MQYNTRYLQSGIHIKHDNKTIQRKPKDSKLLIINRAISKHNGKSHWRQNNWSIMERYWLYIAEGVKIEPMELI